VSNRGAAEPRREPPAILPAWLGATTVESFRSSALGRAPCAAPGTTVDVRDIVDWSAVDRVLSASPAPEVLVVARGHLLPLPPPRSLREARRLLDAGIGFVIRCAERQDAAIAAVTSAIGRDVGGDARAQLFVTPARSHGFGWHYDHEEVFIAQTAGVKDYYFRANTVDPPVWGQRPRSECFGLERSPLCTARLVAGDFLYLPGGWWHMAECREESLSISIGVRPAHTASR
jgi:50S ribosomal protein L16 3-hydroxylase